MRGRSCMDSSGSESGSFTKIFSCQFVKPVLRPKGVPDHREWGAKSKERAGLLGVATAGAGRLDKTFRETQRDCAFHQAQGSC